LGLLAALIAWLFLKSSEDPDKVVVTLPQLSQTLVGVFVSVLAVVLSG
jgi:hypothetical protein